MKGALAIAAMVRAGRVSAAALIEQAIADVSADSLHAVTRVLAARARGEAARVDAVVAAGGDPGPLAGVPYGVKDLFDVVGLPTTAGSAVYADALPAHADAEAIQRCQAAGAVLVATLNMDEFAYGFATINAHHGTTRNPHDPARLAGGSSGGSAAVVAAGLLSFSLGSDTNGSIRVPASLTGIHGLKPTHGALPMAGMFPFAESFDDPGPFAGSAADMAAVWAVLADAEMPVDDDAPIRLALLGGRFRENADPDQLTVIDGLASGAPMLELPDIERARSAAFLITAYEGGSLHRAALARSAMAFDPQVRDRLIAGALLPRALYKEAQAFRAAFRKRIAALMCDVDVLLAPATPCIAPPIDDPRIAIDGVLVVARAHLGIHTQPISLAALPSLSVPLRRPDRLPLGLQLIGRPGEEATLMRYAARLEADGVIGATAPMRARVGEAA
ncbi:AtzE family amidohydrolase [uncultured Sphingomonas sp.]|uniref:AtzE family amidohydrolase n=1 Tax=uncultured Sphingomonas sp. TaxID=158754 RepID=UPI0035CA8845